MKASRLMSLGGTSRSRKSPQSPPSPPPESATTPVVRPSRCTCKWEPISSVRGRISSGVRGDARGHEGHFPLRLSSFDSKARVKSIVVTGCGQGIGLAIFERLSDDGYAVVGVERNV